MSTAEKIIDDFSRAENVQRWLPQNDVVMGGLSNSRIEATNGGTILFTGRVSLENYGGFASVRSQNNETLAGFDGITLHIKGDGKRYGLFLETSALSDDGFYVGNFDTTKDVWTDARLSFQEFTPIVRGEIVPNAPALNLADIEMFGLIIADNQEGVFVLELAEIKAYQEV